MSAKSEGHKSDESLASGASLTLEGLRQYLTEKLHISDVTDSKPSRKVLSDFSIAEIAKLIQNNKCKKIITMAGAGISTSAGIPDFRSPGSGLYNNLQKYNLPHPEAVFELDFFEQNPKPFFVLAKDLYPGSFKPTVCHYFLRLLEQKNVLLRHYTQNIDTLERVAKVSDEKLIEAHGSFFTGHCMCCRKEYSLAWMKEKIFADEIPTCTSCPGVVKPDIIFFGENLPEKFYDCVDRDFKECDLLIIMGSSLVVQPFASLVDRVQDSCPRLLINREKVGQTTGVYAMLGFGGGLEYDSTGNTRDVIWLGDCDEGCQLLADQIGWGEQLKKMVAEEHANIDAEMKSELEIAAKAPEKLPEKISKKVIKSVDKEEKSEKKDDSGKRCGL